MNLSFSEEQEAFREEVADFLRDRIPQELKFNYLRKTDIYEDDQRPIVHELGAKRWLGLHWPEEYGGSGRTLMDSGVLTEELGFAGAPRPSISVSFVGPVLLRYGSDQHRKEFLPRIASGEIHFCEGLTEPNSGSDLASLKTRAHAVEDGYVIEGAKLFTSWAHVSDYCFLLARTDPDLPKHKGLSLFIVDMKDPGVTCGPFKDLYGGHFFNEVFFDKVKISKDSIIGEENRGWEELMHGLNMARLYVGGGTFCAGACKGLIQEVAPCLREIGAKRLPAYVSLRHRLAELRVESEISRLLAYRCIWKLGETGDIAMEVSMTKAFGSELTLRIVDVAMDVLGLHGQLLPRSKGAPLSGIMPLSYIGAIAETIAAGTSDMQRLTIGRKLGLPR